MGQVTWGGEKSEETLGPGVGGSPHPEQDTLQHPAVAVPAAAAVQHRHQGADLLLRPPQPVFSRQINLNKL